MTSRLTAAVDAAMLEMQNISPPLRRSDCERLIRAALKAQPSGVVLPERRPEVSGTWGDMGDAYNAGVNDTLDEVARLNSPPVSAGDGMCNGDNPASRCICREEFGYRVCVPSAGGVDERAAFPVEAHLWPLEIGVEAQQRAADAGCERIDCLHDGVQAMLAALTAPAPNHSEQVREVVPEEWQTMLSRVVDELDSLNCGMRDQIDDDMAEPDEEAELCDATDELIDEARALIAAAPSAGSQGGDV